ncbi:sensor histidine kinase [Polluticoccus soli]|uniref:sensor histidine kinase n=1 Tax=Polluticoccus soli TaxID=3034150 RepID=UPI003B82D755
MEKQEIEFQYERQLLKTKLEVQEKGLNHLSQEIHDNIGQVLTSVYANLITVLNSQNFDARELIEITKNQVSHALKDLRNISHVLNSGYINRIGLEESIKKELDYLSSYHAIEFTTSFDGEIDNLPPDKELMVFRIAQEALTNIVKHANASQVTIAISQDNHDLKMAITDNGIGFADTDEAPKGIGLLTMQQRAEVMNGSLKLTSTQRLGASLILTIPAYE